MSLADDARRSRTILLVDDQADVLGALSVFLRYAFKDLEIRSVRSASEALDTLRRQHVDLVIADYRMPGMDGIRLLKAVGRVAPGVPRILFTAHDEAAKLEAEPDVAERFLSKSIPLEALVEDVQHLLSRTPDGPVL